jgi:hypothetical protein
MIRVLDGRNYAKSSEFVNDLNKARLENKKKWIVYIGTVANKNVEIKTYDTGYLQILRIDGVKHWAHMDMKVTAWKQAITQAIGD